MGEEEEMPVTRRSALQLLSSWSVLNCKIMLSAAYKAQSAALRICFSSGRDVNDKLLLSPMLRARRFARDASRETLRASRVDTRGVRHQTFNSLVTLLHVLMLLIIYQHFALPSQLAFQLVAHAAV